MCGQVKLKGWNRKAPTANSSDIDPGIKTPGFFVCIALNYSNLTKANRMANSTIWSLMSFSMALISYAMNRDISANIFLAAIFIIQAMRVPSEMPERHYELITKFVLLLALGIGIFAAWALFTGADLGRPANFGYRIR